MSDKSAIEWTDATWNPTVGCSIVSPGKKLKEPATVLTMVPKGSPSPEEIKRIADDAERVSDAKKGKGAQTDAPKEPGPAPA